MLISLAKLSDLGKHKTSKAILISSRSRLTLHEPRQDRVLMKGRHAQATTNLHSAYRSDTGLRTGNADMEYKPILREAGTKIRYDNARTRSRMR
jgi:hypothetical protein